MSIVCPQESEKYEVFRQIGGVQRERKTVSDREREREREKGEIA